MAKTPKESPNLLMSVIRTLSASESNEKRDQEKAKLEKEFKRSDAKLDQLVSAHHEDLTYVIQAFSKISARVSASRERIQSIKESLASCKLLLHYRRDELKKLWLEGVEHKQVLQLLEQVVQVKEVPEKLDSYVTKKHYLHATEMLVNAVNCLDSSLCGVEALWDVAQELQSKKEHLHQLLIEDLHKHMYIKSTTYLRTEGTPFQRQGSDRREKKGLLDNKSSKSHLSMHTKTFISPNLQTSPTNETLVPQTINEDLNDPNPEENSAYFMAILVECLALLNKIPDAIEIIKARMQREILCIVFHASQEIVDNSIAHNEAQSNQPRLLLELLEVVFEDFRCIAKAHQIVLANLKRVTSSASPGYQEVHLYDMADVWSKVQAVLQLVLSDYLDIKNTAPGHQQAPSTFTEGTNDTASYFGKKRPPKPKSFSLFKFDASSHAISMNSYLKEQKQDGLPVFLGTFGDVEYGKQKFVCKPDAKNITVIFSPLMNFIQEIETAMENPPRTHCTLHAYLTDYITDVFLGQEHADIAGKIEILTKNVEAWRSVIDQETQKFLNVPRPLLQSTVHVEKSLWELKELLYSLPLYSDQFLNMICNILQNFRDSCQLAFRAIVHPESENKRIISANWAKDNDISRFLRSLPNWLNLQNQKMNQMPDQEESPEQVRARISKESEILTGNLGETLIPQQEILSEVNQFHMLAQLQESIEWFGGRIVALVNELTGNTPGTPVTPPSGDIPPEPLPPISKKTLESLTALTNDFQEMGEICLLVLHLEVRVHCFYFLLPVARQTNYASSEDSQQDPDANVFKLNKDLSNIEEAVSSSLQSRKVKYIFEGLGHLVATIVISSAQHMQKINENGVKKMCRNIFAMQQNLTNITMSRESDLDHARQYFEMLYHTPEDILNSILEQGAQLTHMEYINALSLLHRSQPDSDPSQLESYLKRLQEILKGGATTV